MQQVHKLKFRFEIAKQDTAHSFCNNLVTTYWSIMGIYVRWSLCKITAILLKFLFGKLLGL